MWTIQQEGQFLPISYFHVVFTLLHELNELCLHFMPGTKKITIAY